MRKKYNGKKLQKKIIYNEKENFMGEGKLWSEYEIVTFSYSLHNFPN